MDHFEELVKEFLEGDNKAFEAIYMATYKNVYFTCLSFLKNEKDAEDVTQDVYEAVYKNVKTLKNPENLQVWIYKIAVNKCKNVLKKEKAILVEEETLENVVIEKNENFLPEEYITEKSKRKIVMDIMRKKLSDIQYQTVILFYFNELSVEEIADIMECPPGTVKYRLSVSRAKIKEGVLEYEKQSRDKLYSFAPIPFLTGLLAMEAEAAETPEMWSGIVQRLNILQGGMVAGATHTACQVAAEGLASEGAETLHSEGKVIAERAVIDTMKGSRFMDKLGKILLSIFKSKIAISMIIVAVLTSLAVAVVNIIDNAENNSDKTEAVQDDKEENNKDKTEVVQDDSEETVSTVDGAVLEDGVEESEWSAILKNEVDILALEYCLGIMTKCKIDGHENYVEEALIDLDTNIYYEAPFDLHGRLQFGGTYNHQWFDIYKISELNKVYGLMPEGAINESNIPSDAYMNGDELGLNTNVPEEYCIEHDVDMDGLTSYISANCYHPCPMSVSINYVDATGENKIIVEYTYALSDIEGNVIYDASPFVAYLEPDESGRYVITYVEKK